MLLIKQKQQNQLARKQLNKEIIYKNEKRLKRRFFYDVS